jgi:protein-tyrosine-phosphatase
MAQAFAIMAGVEAMSAGSKPSGIVHPKAIASMAELGYDLSTHRSTSVGELPQVEFDLIATMGCGDACPNVPARLREDWEIPDPKHMDAHAFAAIRDKIADAVADALRRLHQKRME